MWLIKPYLSCQVQRTPLLHWPFVKSVFEYVTDQGGAICKWAGQNHKLWTFSFSHKRLIIRSKLRPEKKKKTEFHCSIQTLEMHTYLESWPPYDIGPLGSRSYNLLTKSPSTGWSKARLSRIWFLTGHLKHYLKNRQATKGEKSFPCICILPSSGSPWSMTLEVASFFPWWRTSTTSNKVPSAPNLKRQELGKKGPTLNVCRAAANHTPTRLERYGNLKPGV
jgi:hypothetical protein